MHVCNWKVELDFETTKMVFLALNLKNGLAKSIFFNFQFESFPLPVKNLTWRRWFHSSLRPITKAVFSPRCKQFVTNSLRSNFEIVLGLRRPRPLDLSFSDLQRRDFPHLHYSEHYCRVCVRVALLLSIEAPQAEARMDRKMTPAAKSIQQIAIWDNENRN